MGIFSRTAARVWGWGSRLFHNSFVNTIADKAADFISRTVDNSLFVRFFSRYHIRKETKESSFFYRFFVEKPAGLFKRFRLFCMRSYERSFFAGILEKLSRMIFSTSVHSWAIGLIVGGIISVTISVTLFFEGTGGVFFSENVLCGFILALLGIVLIFCNDSLAYTLYDSQLCRTAFTSLGGVRSEWFRRDETGENRYVLPLIVGVALGLSATFIPAIYLILGVVGLALVVLIFKTPELGALTTAVLLPFAPTMGLVALCGLTLVSYLGKVLRGKRSLKFQLMDLWVVAFCVVLAYAAFTSIERASSIKILLVYLCYISLYFVIVNTINTTDWARRMVWGVFLSGTLAALYGIVQYVTGGAAKSIIWVDTSMFSDIAGRAYGSFGNPNVFGEFLVMMLPLSAVMLAKTKGWKRVFSLFGFACTGIALVLTMSRGAWLAAILSFGLFLIIFSRGFLKLAFFGIFAIPFLPSVLPSSIVSRFTSIGNMTDTSTSYRVSIWMGSLKMLKDFWPCGVGLGSDAFLKVYPRYALSSAGYALHAHNLFLNFFLETGIFGITVFLILIIYFLKLVVSSFRKIADKKLGSIILALGAGVLGLLIQGMTDNVWFNYKIFLQFFLFLGLAGALRKTHIENRGEDLD